MRHRPRPRVTRSSATVTRNVAPMTAVSARVARAMAMIEAVSTMRTVVASSTPARAAKGISATRVDAR